MRSSVSDNDAQAEMTSEVLDEPDVNVKSNKKENNWWLLYHYDHLAYGEIHWRVQNDILYNQQNSITGLELHIDYTDVPDEDFQSNRSGTYGRADVYKDTPNGITYLWEVKPPSYRDKNKSKGLDQINRYVNNGYGNFDFGSNSLGSVNESEFQFHLTLDCSNGVDSWIEEVTYTVSYELLENGLVIYDFVRDYTKKKKNKRQQDSESNSGSGEGTGTGENTETGSGDDTGEGEGDGDDTSSQDTENTDDNTSDDENNNNNDIPWWLPWWLRWLLVQHIRNNHII